MKWKGRIWAKRSLDKLGRTLFQKKAGPNRPSPLPIDVPKFSPLRCRPQRPKGTKIIQRPSQSSPVVVATCHGHHQITNPFRARPRRHAAPRPRTAAPPLTPSPRRHRRAPSTLGFGGRARAPPPRSPALPRPRPSLQFGPSAAAGQPLRAPLHPRYQPSPPPLPLSPPPAYSCPL